MAVARSRRGEGKGDGEGSCAGGVVNGEKEDIITLHIASPSSSQLRSIVSEQGQLLLLHYVFCSVVTSFPRKRYCMCNKLPNLVRR